MPILSYLALPRPGAAAQLAAELTALPHCEIIPSDNRDVIVLVTDTPDETAEQELQQKLKKLPSLQSLSMTFGCNAE